MKKKILIGCSTVVILFIIAFVIFSFWFMDAISDNLSKKEIFSLVNENYTFILEEINENDFSDIEKLNGVKEVYFDDGVLDVYCGGSGIGSATSYYGFYYSPDDQPKDTWAGTSFGSIEELKSDGNGFSLKNSNDDNYYYTEKIRDNFYYYEAHF